MGERIGVSDDEWALISPLLPAERGRGCRPAGDNRPYFEGMVWMARTGATLAELIAAFRRNKEDLGWLAHPHERHAWAFLLKWYSDPNWLPTVPKTGPDGRVS